MATTDAEIVRELIWLIAERKGLTTLKINFEDGTSENQMHASRNWIIEAVKGLTPIVAACRDTP